jgi:hypothetical protein
MRVFTVAWALVAVVVSVLLVPAGQLWGYGAAACAVWLFLSPRVRVRTAAAGMSLAVGATVAGLAVADPSGRRGYPYGWLTRDTDYLDLPGVVPLPGSAADAGQALDVPLLLLVLAMWGVFGLALAVGCGVVVRQAGRVGLLGIRRGSFLDSGNA